MREQTGAGPHIKHAAVKLFFARILSGLLPRLQDANRRARDVRPRHFEEGRIDIGELDSGAAFLMLGPKARQMGRETSVGSLAAHIDANYIALGVSRIHLPTGEDRMSSVPGVFAAGDMRRGQSLVVWAISEGRKASEGGRPLLDG